MNLVCELEHKMCLINYQSAFTAILLFWFVTNYLLIFIHLMPLLYRVWIGSQRWTVNSGNYALKTIGNLVETKGVSQNTNRYVQSCA